VRTTILRAARRRPRFAGRESPGPRVLQSLAACICAAGVLVLAGCRAAPARPPAEITVSAAADLMEALPELTAAFESETGVRVITNYGASGQLAQQIAQGAPVDVFMSADVHYVEQLGDAGLLLRGTRSIYATGNLVMWVPPGVTPPGSIDDLASPRIHRIALANPQTAPYGRAAEQALRMAGLWSAVKAKVVFAENVRQALMYARSGSADVAFVAASVTPRAGGQSLPVPQDLYASLYQAMAVVRDTRSEPAARTFAAFVASPAGQAILRRYSFGPPPAPGE
jgi:molybdate transport system substrate-binding protein